MKFLLTSGGIKNDSIRHALVDLLGKPIAESSALCIPTALHANAQGPALSSGCITRRVHHPLVRSGVEVVGRAGAHRAAQYREERWLPQVQETDALLVEGGDPLYLCYWMRQSGLADLLPELRARRSMWD